MTQRQMIRLFLVGCILFLFLGSETFAEDISLTLTIQKSYKNEFGSGNAFTETWTGDVLFEDAKIGEYTGVVTRTIFSSLEAVQYDIMIPYAGSLGDFISIRMNRSTEGSYGSDNVNSHGVIYAASPNCKSLIGLSVTITGNTNVIKITY
jgi:hypothetical protein